MNTQMKKHMEEALAQGIRLDGRKLDEFRPITIETNVVANAEGSAKVTCGDTVILGGVKLTLGTPFSDRPANGALMVNAEMSCIANRKFESGPPGMNAIEASRVIDRGIRESGCIDEKKLCVTAGEKVWIANIDLYPLNFSGNFIDVGGIAAIVAAKLAQIPSVTKEKTADYKKPSKNKLPLSGTPIPVSVVKIGESLLLDPTQEEEEMSDCRLTITTIDDGSICSLQKSGDAPIVEAEMELMLDMAIGAAKKIRKDVEKACK